MSLMMKSVLVLGCLLSCIHCAKPPEPPPKVDETKEAWYGEAVTELRDLTARAEEAFSKKNADEASHLIQKGEPVAARLLKVTEPTLEALETASDLDDLYGRMLLSNKHYGWARMIFQRNVARWKNREPQTEDTVRRRKQAEMYIMECDRNIR